MKAPFHLWLIGILSLLWNAGGAYDYLMTQTGNVTYLEMLTPEQLDYLNSAPVWFVATWATGVWFAVLGSILLLMRSRFAGTAFAVALVGFVVSAVYSYVLASPSALGRYIAARGPQDESPPSIYCGGSNLNRYIR